MNRQHLSAFVWLRWRLFVNQMKRGGIANRVILAILAVGAVMLALFLFAGSFLVGLFVLGEVSPAVLLLVWDGLVLSFLFVWTAGLLTELQRSDGLALNKFLHLPVSLTGAFLINYLSSLFNLAFVLFLPAFVGLSLGLLFARGPAFLVLFPLLAAFLLMVTALTYQLQGWLAALMVNPRRRRTVIVVATGLFILVFQAPNLVNILRPWGGKPKPATVVQEQRLELQRLLAAGKLTAAEYAAREQEIHRQVNAQVQEADRQAWAGVEWGAWYANLFLPPGWLPLGAAGAAEGAFVPAMLGTLGMGLLGTFSLWRAYRTTVRLYTGQVAGQGAVRAAPSPAIAPAAVVKDEQRGRSLLERDLPWVSEQAAVVALAGLRSLLRAPEAKMMLLTPILLVLIPASVFVAHPTPMPEAARPLLTFGALSMVLFGLVQLGGNQFGLDRGGFRVFVLSPAPRRDLLLGKNLSFAPLALGLSVVAVVLIQVLRPLRFDHLLATLPQGVSMYLLFCLVMNLMSILAPWPLPAGSFKPARPKLTTVLLQLVFLFLFPPLMAMTLLPLGVEVGLEALDVVKGLPVCLALSVVEVVVVVCLYRVALTAQGELLQGREQKILEVVTAQAE